MNSKQLLVGMVLLAGLLQGISAQVTVAKIPLTGYLKDLQEEFGVQFKYASKSLDGLSVDPPQKDDSLLSILDKISKQTGLVFSQLPGNFISVSKKSSSVCGFVKERVSAKPIAYCTVTIGALSTITDENGYFEIAKADLNALVRISHLGYKTFELAVKNIDLDQCRELYLVAKETRLPEVVLYDYLIRGIDKLDNGAHSINFEKFTILPGLIEQDVLQSIQAFPGIQSINETVSDINIRGGSNDQNLILWDGIKMYQSGHFFGLISMYNPHITQKVSLQKNGTPPAYTDGLSGTISMETSNQITDRLKGSIGINFLDANGYSDVPLGDKASVQLAARKSLSDFVQTPTYTEYFKRISQDTELDESASNFLNSEIGFDFYDASMRFVYRPRNQETLQLNFITTHNDLQFNENATIEGKEESRESSLVQNTIGAGLQYNRTWNNQFQTSIQLYNTDYKLKAINANIPDDQRFLQENLVSETAARFSVSMPLSDILHLDNGYHFTETKVTNLDDVDDPVFRDLQGRVLREHALFTQLGIDTPNRKTTVNVGLRVNFLERFSVFLVEPRLSFNQKLGERFNLEILGELKHQNTSQVINFQNDFLGVEKRRWQLTDNSLIPVIQSKQASVGLSYNHKGWLFSADGYYKAIEGITSQSQGFQGQYEFVKSIGSYDATGIDLLLRKQTGQLNTWLSYALLSSKYDFPELNLEQFPNNYEIPNAISAGMVWAPESFRVAAGINWREGKPISMPNEDAPVMGNTINYGSPNSSRLPNYMRVDLSAVYYLRLDVENHLQFGLSVWNVLDRDNILNAYYRLDEDGEPVRIEQTSLGITPNALIRFHF